MITGVPDSKLKDWLKNKEYIIACNEGHAVGMAVGHYLATKETATVFMQSDGFCNALNAITSLVIPYEIPINWVISIRTDPPQHIVMGTNIKKLLKIFNIKAKLIL